MAGSQRPRPGRRRERPAGPARRARRRDGLGPPGRALASRCQGTGSRLPANDPAGPRRQARGPRPRGGRPRRSRIPGHAVRRPRDARQAGRRMSAGAPVGRTTAPVSGCTGRRGPAATTTRRSPGSPAIAAPDPRTTDRATRARAAPTGHRPGAAARDRARRRSARGHTNIGRAIGPTVRARARNGPRARAGLAARTARAPATTGAPGGHSPPVRRRRPTGRPLRGART